MNERAAHFAQSAMDDPSSSLVSGLVLLWVIGLTLSLRIAQWKYGVPVKKMTPAQIGAGFAITMVYVGFDRDRLEMA